MRAMATLVSIRKEPVEHGYWANNKTGKVSKVAVGNESSVDTYEGLGVRGYTNSFRVQRRKPATILHNHPGGAALPLSADDYAQGLPVVAIDRRGNTYRGKSKLIVMADRMEARDLHERVRMGIHAQAVEKFENERQGKPFPSRTNHFLLTHHANKQMAKVGAQTYRSKLISSAKTADKVAGGFYAKAAEKSYRKEYLQLPAKSRLREKLAHPGHRKTILSPKALAQQSRPWEEKHPLKHLQQRKQIAALGTPPQDWKSKMKRAAGVKVKNLPVILPPVSQDVAIAAARQATRGNRIVSRRLN